MEKGEVGPAVVLNERDYGAARMRPPAPLPARRAYRPEGRAYAPEGKTKILTTDIH